MLLGNSLPKIILLFYQVLDSFYQIISSYIPKQRLSSHVVISNNVIIQYKYNNRTFEQEMNVLRVKYNPVSNDLVIQTSRPTATVNT